MLESYANNLEVIVNNRTKELEVEKQRSEDLLLRIFPKRVLEQLKQGVYVKAEQFDSVSVYFSDIVEFTPLAAKMTVYEVIDFLNDLFTFFDTIFSNFDVYKLATIGKFD